MNASLRLALAFLGSLALLNGPILAEGTVECLLDNRMGVALTLYVDGDYGCGPALPNLTCTAQVPIGPQLWEAKNGDKVIASLNTTVVQGKNRVFLVCNIDPRTQRCVGM
jgi:hypothetical protein